MAEEGDQPWYLAEAEKGNADAEYRLGVLFSRKGRPPGDRAKTAAWLCKSAGHGNQLAIAQVARNEFTAAKFAESAQHFAQQRRDNARLAGAIAWTYLARARGGDPAQALRQLKDERTEGASRVWDDNVLDFHLGLIDAAALLKLADKQPRKERRPCEVTFHAAQAHLIAGKLEPAIGALHAVRNMCLDSTWEYRSAGEELARLQAPPS